MGLVNDVTTIADLPRIVSLSHGERTALISNGQRASYRQLDQHSNRIANALIRRGVAQGDRLAILSKDSLQSLELIFGAAKTNAVLVNINWRFRAEEIAYILHDARAKLIFVDSDFTGLIPQVAERLLNPPAIVEISTNGSGESLADWASSEADFAPEVEHHAEDIVVQIYTSGTTGHPKGVLLPNRSFFAIAQEMASQGDPWIGWTDETVSLLFVPTFHIGGLWWLIRGLALGSTIVVLRAFEPAAILRAIPEYRVNNTCMVPSMMQVLLAEPGCNRTNFQSLDTIVYGGSPISAELLKRAMDVFHCSFCQIYGMTETGNMAVCLRPRDHENAVDQRFRSVGVPLPGVEVRILDPQRNPLPPSEVGEIAIKSPARMQGYWNLPQATADVLNDGWIMTGDAGYRDQDGFIYLCDRVKDMIISAGENIYPAEIENAIRRQAGIADAAVIGVPDDLWGEVVKAVVVRNADSTVSAGDVIQHARAHLAEFKVPRSVDFVSELPRTASGKILKAKLREPYWKDRERRIN